MKKIALLALILAPMFAHAQSQWTPWSPTLPNVPTYSQFQQPFCNGSTCTYVPLEPLGPGTFSYPSLQSYLQAAFSILLTLGALFAVVMLTLSGIRYMLSESFTDRAKAVQRIRSSVLGLLLLASSWLILNTINPDLLVFNIKNIPVQGVQPTQSGGTGQLNIDVRCTGSCAPSAAACEQKGSGYVYRYSTNYNQWICEYVP